MLLVRALQRLAPLRMLLLEIAQLLLLLRRQRGLFFPVARRLRLPRLLLLPAQRLALRAQQGESRCARAGSALHPNTHANPRLTRVHPS